MAKDGSIYLLSREIKGDKGEVYMQNVTVFATSQTHARAIVNEQFTRLRSISQTAASRPTRRCPIGRSTRSRSTSTR